MFVCVAFMQISRLHRALQKNTKRRPNDEKYCRKECDL